MIGAMFWMRNAVHAQAPRSSGRPPISRAITSSVWTRLVAVRVVDVAAHDGDAA